VANHADTTIALTDAPDDDERAVIMDGLRAYNDAQAGVSDGGPLAILVRDPETKKVAGGLLGRTYLGLLTVTSAHSLNASKSMRKKFASWVRKAYCCAPSLPLQAQKRRVLAFPGLYRSGAPERSRTPNPQIRSRALIFRRNGVPRVAP
jgi:hypothetical protein